jgi:hypothetical protein
MKAILLSFSIFALISCEVKHKKVDRGIVKEKFITSTKYGEPEYHIITENHVYDVTGDEYAQNQVGERFVENVVYFE